MSKSAPSAKLSSGASPASPDALTYVPDIGEWPDSWMVDQPDRATGQAIVTVLTPFIEHLINQGLTKRTIKHHVDNLWALGGEMITAIHWVSTQTVCKGFGAQRHCRGRWSIAK